jgi:uncharacterized phiE125 gp8 family phage protein
MGLQPITSSVNPVTLDAVKAHLRIVNDLTLTTSSDDTSLSVFLTAAFEYVETETRQQLCTREYRLTLDGFPGDDISRAGECLSFDRFGPGRAIKLPKPPLQSVASIQYIDPAGNLQTVNPATYSVDATQLPGRIVLKPGQSWPATDGSANCVIITLTAGYGADGTNVPTLLKQAVLLLSGHWFENREDAGSQRINSIPTGVAAIVTQQTYREAI